MQPCIARGMNDKSCGSIEFGENRAEHITTKPKWLPVKEGILDPGVNGHEKLWK